MSSEKFLGQRNGSDLSSNIPSREIIKQAAELVGVDSSTVIGALRRYYQTAGGLTWEIA